MNEPYIRKEDELTIIELVNHLVMIEGKEPVKISICDLERLSDITLTKEEILKISRFVKANTCCQTLEINNILIETQPDWLTIKCNDNIVIIRPEMFDKIVKYLDESEEQVMKESNATQEIFNKLVNLNNSQNTASCEKPTKPITTGQTQTKKTIYDSVVDTMKNNSGSNDNGK